MRSASFSAAMRTASSFCLRSDSAFSFLAFSSAIRRASSVAFRSASAFWAATILACSLAFASCQYHTPPPRQRAARRTPAILNKGDFPPDDDFTFTFPSVALTNSIQDENLSSGVFASALASAMRTDLGRSDGSLGASRPTTFIITTGSPVWNTLSKGTAPVTSSWKRTASEY